MSPSRRPGRLLTLLLALLGLLGWLAWVVANQVLGEALLAVPWLAAALVVVGLPAWAVRQRLAQRAGRDAADGAATRAGLPVPLPPAPELVGRSGELALAVQRACASGLLLVHGPRGIGTSALALAAAHQLAGGAVGVYVDLRASRAGGRESAARARTRVLAALGLVPPRAPTGEAAYEQVARELRDTGRVLVLDNVRAAEQVEWLVRPIPGAYVVAAGDVPPWPGPAELPVGPLAAADGLALLRADPAVAQRAQPGRPGVRRLAQAYLKSPAVVLALRSWLAANPLVGVPALVADLDGQERRPGPAPAEPSELLRMVLELQTRGLSAPAMELLALLPDVPLTWLTDAAAAALLGRPVPEAVPVLTELTRAGLLVAVTPRQHRVPREARALGLHAGDRAPAALGRLVAHYAGEAIERLVALTGTGRPDRSGAERAAEAWFRREDLALLALLERPDRLPRSAAPRVALVADALDVWFTRDSRPADRRAAAEAALAAAATLAHPDGQLTAVLRLAAVARAEGELDEAADHLRRAGELGADDARLGTGLGQQALATGDPAGARQEFERNLARRPRRDAVGRVIDQLDLSAVLIVQGQPDRALPLLRDASGQAQQAGDLAGVAYAQELLGVVAARRVERTAALAVWADAQLLRAAARRPGPGPLPAAPRHPAGGDRAGGRGGDAAGQPRAARHPDHRGGGVAGTPPAGRPRRGGRHRGRGVAPGGGTGRPGALGGPDRPATGGDRAAPPARGRRPRTLAMATATRPDGVHRRPDGVHRRRAARPRRCSPSSPVGPASAAGAGPATVTLARFSSPVGGPDGAGPRVVTRSPRAAADHPRER